MGGWATVVLAATLSTSPAPQRCELPDGTRAWMQRALDGWSVAQSELLKKHAPSLPWMIFFDERCAWHVAPGDALARRARPSGLRFRGKAVRVAALAHGGELALPDGRRIPAQHIAFTAPYRNASFFVVALPPLWRAVWRPEEPGMEEFFLGVALHELAHTEQIKAVERRLEALNRQVEVPESLNDDAVETRFGKDAEFRALFERERELFYLAAAEPDDARARQLAAEALALARERRERFFVGKDAVFTDIEGLFLNLEGVGGWVAYEMARRDPVNFSFDRRVIETRGRSTDWVQGESLALMLLIDRFVPGWQRHMLAPRLASPFRLLEEALAAGEDRSSRVQAR